MAKNKRTVAEVGIVADKTSAQYLDQQAALAKKNDQQLVIHLNVGGNLIYFWAGNKPD